jgi:hypothetical protein
MGGDDVGGGVGLLGARRQEGAMSETPGQTPPPVDAPLPVDMTPDVVARLRGGLGTEPSTPIAVLPPVDQLDLRPSLSPRTGEPRRPAVLVVALSCFYAAMAVGVVTLVFVWWNAIHMTTFDHAARVIEWLDPRPGTERYAGTWQSIAAAVLLVATGVVMVAGPWLQAFNAWQGHRWTRVFGFVCVPISGLAWLMTTGTPTFTAWSHWLTWLPWLAVPFSLVGALLMWLPPVRRFLSDFRTVRHPAPPTPPPSSGVVYGPLDRYR